MSKNVFIFGAGADKNFYPGAPLGNEFILKIFSNLDVLKKVIKSEDVPDDMRKYIFIYENFRKNIYNKFGSGNNYFFDWKPYLDCVLKNGIAKLNHGLFPINE